MMQITKCIDCKVYKTITKHTTTVVVTVVGTDSEAPSLKIKSFA
jgi:hypothetical protein